MLCPVAEVHGWKRDCPSDSPLRPLFSFLSAIPELNLSQHTVGFDWRNQSSYTDNCKGLPDWSANYNVCINSYESSSPYNCSFGVHKLYAVQFVSFGFFLISIMIF